MKISFTAATLTLAIATFLVGCKKDTAYTSPSAPSAYYNQLAVGKYAIYQLDSLTFYYYGQLDTVTHYHAKDSVEEAFTDNEGRASWRVVRYLTDPAESQPWTPNMTIVVTPSIQRIEVVENNWRFIKLAFPISEGSSWSGNSYLPYAPYQDEGFDFSDGKHLALGQWTYTYNNVDKPATIGNQSYDSTVTVQSIDDSLHLPIVDPTLFASKSYWAETYAKNIGLVYRRTAIWEYQPPTPNGSQSGYKIGYELTMTMLSHN